MNIEDVLLKEIINIMYLIKDRRYSELVKENHLTKETEERIVDEINLYGGEITSVDVTEYKRSFQYMRINNTNEYKVYLDFWIDNERSDLTLICDIELGLDNRIINSTIDEVHVL